MSILQTAIDFRKLSRASRLIASDNPEEAAKELQSILNESLLAMQSGNRFVQKNAVNELSNLRNAIVAGQIKAGKQSAALIGAYSHTIDSFNRNLENTKPSDNSIDQIFDNIAGNIPSIDTLTSALITANPIMGYGVKMIRDFSNSRKEASQRAKEQHAERLRLAEEEKDEISKLLMDVPEPLQEPLQELQTDSSEQVELLKQINQTTIEMLRVWDSSSEHLKRIDDQAAEQIRLAEQSADEAEMRRVEEQRRQEVQGQPDADFDPNTIIDRNAALNIGLAGGTVAGLIGAVSGIFGAIAGFVAGIVGLPLAGFIAAGVAIFKFVDGFLTASKIFTGEVGLVERFSAGMGSLAAGVINLVDTILEWFGVDIIDMDGEELKLTISHFIRDTIDEIVDFFKSAFDSVMGFVNDAKEFLSDPIGNSLKWVKDKASEFVEDVRQADKPGFVGDTGLVPGTRDAREYNEQLEKQRKAREEQIQQEETLNQLNDKMIDSGMERRLNMLQNQSSSSVIQDIDSNQITNVGSNSSTGSSTNVVDARQNNVVNSPTTNVYGRSAHNVDPDFRKHFAM